MFEGEPTAEQAVKAVEYLKTLSPSGVELEILMLGTFDFSQNIEPTEMIKRLLAVLAK